MLKFFTAFIVQSKSSGQLLQTIGFIKNVIVGGDTRFDRVIDIADHFQSMPVFDQFCQSGAVIVAGSTWTEDDEELDHFANTHPDIKFIIAPHDIDEDRLKECTTLYKRSIRYSSYEKKFQSGSGIPANINVMIIDNVGMLSRLYNYATICYVGGGFGDDGIHNILEAAVYGKPVVFGPVYDKYFEAEELLDCGGAFSIEDSLELEDLFTELLKNKDVYENAAVASKAYVKNKAGATQKVMDYIEANRLLIN